MMNKIKSILILVLSAVLIMQAVKGRDKSEALDSCVEEIINKCLGIFSYTVSLEEENSKLNDRITSLNKEVHRCR